MASMGSSKTPPKKAKSSLGPEPHNYLSASAFCDQSCNLVSESTVEVNPAVLVALRSREEITTDGDGSLELTHSSSASNVVTLKQNSVNVSQHVVGTQPYSSNQLRCIPTTDAAELSTISSGCTETPDEKRRRLRNEAARKRYAHNPTPAREAAKKRYEANPEAAKQAARNRYATNPEAAQQAARKRYEANPEAAQQAARKRYEANPEAVQQAARNRYEVNPEAAKQAASKRYQVSPEASRQVARIRYEANPEPRREAARQASQRRRNAFRPVQQQWDIDHPCRHCGHIWLMSSDAGLRKKCCQNGTLWDESSPFILRALPEALEHGFFSEEFVKASNQYNNILSLGAIGIDNEQPTPGWDVIRGSHSVRLSGRTYHFIPASNTRGGIQYFLHDGRNIELAAHGRERNVDVPTLERLFECLQEQNRLCKSYAAIGSMAERLLMPNQDGSQAFTRESLNELCPQLSRETVEFDVSSITVDRSTGSHVLRVAVKGTGRNSNIQSTSILFEPIGYPLLFPYGEIGWGEEHRTGKRSNGSTCMKISFPDYLASRMLMPERYRMDCYREMDIPDDEVDNPDYGRFGRVCIQKSTQREFFLPASRFDRFHRLGQVYLVDQMSRAIDYRLDHLRRNEDHIFGGQSRDNGGLDDNSDDEIEPHEHQLLNDQQIDPNSRPTFLGDSFTGSKRHLKKQATNALHVVSQKGSSHIFATLTTNKSWPEFEEVVWPDSDVFDLPTIVAEVFHARLQAFLHNLRHGKYFGNDKTVFIVRVIEYQERGLPHAHIVIRLEKAAETIQLNFQDLMEAYEALPPEEQSTTPAPTMDDAAALWVDQHISAEMPDDPRLPECQGKYGDEDSREFQDALRLFLGIQKFHIHKHSGPGLVNGCLDKNGKCKKGFMKTVIREKTTFSKEGFPEYKRRNVADLNVVPYNREIFLDWDGHCNIEFSGLTYTILYLYKYLFKGPSKVQLSFTAPPATRPGVLPLHPRDEIGRYIRGRRLCSMDAMWRLLGFSNYPASEPAVIGVKVRPPDFVRNYDQKELLLHIVVYFNRPIDQDGPNLRSLLFSELFQYYRVVREVPTLAWQQKHNADPRAFFHLSVLDGHYKKPVYLIKRDPNIPVLCRLHTVAFSSGDLWFARLLLKLFPFLSFTDMKTFEGKEYDSFQEAAIARGITSDAQETLECYQLAAIDDGRTPRELRALFITMALNAFPVFVIYNVQELRDLMLEVDWIDAPRHDNPSTDRRLAYEHLLADFRDRFAEHGKTNSDFELPEPANARTQIERYNLRFGDLGEQSRLYQDLKASKPLNQQQQLIFDKFTHLILNQSKTAEGIFLTLEGSGGCGKTELAKQIMTFIRATPCGNPSTPKTVHTVCSTALGAQNFPQGECSTAHSFFCLPVEEEFDKEVDDDEGIKCNAALNPERYALIKAADVIFWDEAMANHRECLEAVMREFDNFKGKVLILMFDAKQMLPVVPGGDHMDVVKACIFSSHHWPRFQRHLLVENMRLQRVADPIDQAHQINYDAMIRGVGENRSVNRLLIQDEVLEGEEESATEKRFTLSAIPDENIFNVDDGASSFERAIAWLYPHGYSAEHAAKNVVLATTNAIVDEWNDRIAALNTNPALPPLLSTDTFSDVDDTHGHLKQMISDEILQKYNTNDVPPHELFLKVGDVCLVMRNLSVNDGITNNTRVKILKVTRRYITCQTLGTRPVPVVLPRIRFNFRLPYGQSFTMTRLQFPLRRAFCLSVHKSQGQTLGRALIDARGGFFAHGHLYVGLSRVTHYQSISLFLNSYQLYFSPCPSVHPMAIPLHNKPFLSNIVYPEAILEIQSLQNAFDVWIATATPSSHDP